MSQMIPSYLLAVCSEVAARRESHATLDRLFTYAGAPGDPPTGSKQAKALAWLRHTNKDNSLQPLGVLGRLIEPYMEQPLEENNPYDDGLRQDREKITKALAHCELQHVRGGQNRWISWRTLSNPRRIYSPE